jgi:immunoglobulin superfamily DCC subclass member 4
VQDVSVEPFFQVQRLKPFTNYTFYVRGYTVNMASDPSESIRCTTDESSPMTVPTITTLQAISPTSVKVGWERLPPELARGNILSHKVQYKVLNTNSAWVDEVPSSMFNYTITGEFFLTVFISFGYYIIF